MAVVRFNAIRNGRISGTQEKEYDGDREAIQDLVMADIYDGMCPARQAMEGRPVTWVEAVYVK